MVDCKGCLALLFVPRRRWPTSHGIERRRSGTISDSLPELESVSCLLLRIKRGIGERSNCGRSHSTVSNGMGLGERKNSEKREWHNRLMQYTCSRFTLGLVRLFGAWFQPHYAFSTCLVLVLVLVHRQPCQDLKRYI